MADPALEEAAVAAQRALRGHLARKNVEAQKLYVEYEQQMAEQEVQQRRQLAEGLQLVHADKVRRDSEKQLLLQKATSFVEKHEQSEAARRMNVLTTTLLKTKTLVRRLRTRLSAAVANRKAEEERLVAEEKQRKLDEARAEEERKAAKARSRQEEMAALEAEFLSHQGEREAKAQESVRLVEQHASDLDLLHAELAETTQAAKHQQHHREGGASEDEASGGGVGETKSSRSSGSSSSSSSSASVSPRRSETGGRPGSSSGILPAIASGRDSSSSGGGSAAGSPTARVNWSTPAVSVSPRSSAAAADEDTAAAELAAMTAQALLTLQETLQVRGDGGRCGAAAMLMMVMRLLLLPLRLRLRVHCPLLRCWHC